MNLYDIDVLKAHLKGLNPKHDYFVVMNATSQPETIDGLEEVYWVEDDKHPWILVRGKHNVLLLCTAWVRLGRSAYAIHCVRHGVGTDVLRHMYTLGHCTCR